MGAKWQIEDEGQWGATEGFLLLFCFLGRRWPKICVSKRLRSVECIIVCESGEAEEREENNYNIYQMERLLGFRSSSATNEATLNLPFLLPMTSILTGQLGEWARISKVLPSCQNSSVSWSRWEWSMLQCQGQEWFYSSRCPSECDAKSSQAPTK